MYSEKVMDHFSNPRNVGEISDANAVGQVGNPKCGDIMKIYMKIIMICENLDAKSGLFFNIRSISYLKKQCLKMSVSVQ